MIWTPSIDWSLYDGRGCYSGLDLSSIHDLSSVAHAFPNHLGGHDLLVKFWAPRESILKKEHQDKVPYTSWEKMGAIVLTDGETIDYELIEETIVADSARFNLLGFGADSWNFEMMGQRLLRRGLEVEKYGQGFPSMTAPSKEFERQIINQCLRHDGNPVMRWCVSNVAVKKRGDEILPVKSKSTGRIDGVIASIIAIAMDMTDENKGGSVYNERGLMTL